MLNFHNISNQYRFQHVFNLLFLKIGAKLAKAKTKMLHFHNITNESCLQTRIHRDLWGWGGEGVRSQEPHANGKAIALLV